MGVSGLVLRGRYRLDELIASGGMGEVWRGTDLAIDRRVAIKVLLPEHADDEDGVARFRAEAHHAGSLSHPNIAQVFDYGEAQPPEPGYLVMELVEGLSLTRILDDGPLLPGDVMDVIAQAARGLAAAHHAGLVHRDIKPGNLLVRADGLVKITDFGIAHPVGETPVTQPVTQPGMLIGTPAYLAPERITGIPATPATDLYALGVVAHQCLTGQVPFAGEPLAVALAHLDRGIPALPASVPPAVSGLVAELTRKDPAARPRSAWDVAVRAEHLRVTLSSSDGPSADGSSPDGTAAAPPAGHDAWAAGPVVPGSVAGPVMAGSGAAGPALAGPALAGPALAGPALAGPALAGAVLAGAGADAAPPAGWSPRPRRPRTSHRSRGRRTGAPGPRRSRVSLPVRGALALTGVASVGFISWTLATLPGSAGDNQPSVVPPAAATHRAGPSGLPRQSPVAATHIAGANGGNAFVARASATPQASGSRTRPAKSPSASPDPTTPVPTTPAPTTPVPTTPAPTTPVPTTPVPTTPLGSLSPSALATAPASVSVTPEPSLLVLPVVP